MSSTKILADERGAAEGRGKGQMARLVFALLAGVFLFVTVVKFGNPVVLDKVTPPPVTASDMLYQSWPSRWAMPLLIPLIIAGLIAARWERLRLRWVALLPGAWLAWEFVASAWTVNPILTGLTLQHFSVAVGLFYLAYFGWDRECEWAIWAGLALGICYSMRVALEQHFGGLAATQKMLYSDPGASGLSPAVINDPEFRARIAKLRIFGTFVYPNALAGGLLLLAPLAMAFVWRVTPKVRTPARTGFVVVLGGVALGCLYWSGSKAGWLTALALGVVALWYSRAPRKWKVGVIGAILVCGLAGFAVKYGHFFEQQRNSVGARVEYWKAACRITAQNPLVGTGPGTFGIEFNRIRPAGAEPARLAHDDYLEQACDSGILGAVLYTGMILMALRVLYRYSTCFAAIDWVRLAVWLGISGLALHSLVEFHLYIPALAWPMFFMMGGQIGEAVNDKAYEKMAR